MAALTAAEFKPAGTVETLICELCFDRFEFTHNGQWVPVSCPTCASKLKARWQVSPKEQKLIDEIMEMLK